MKELNTKHFNLLSKLFYTLDWLQSGKLKWTMKDDDENRNLWAVKYMLKEYEKAIKQTNLIYEVSDYNIIEYQSNKVALFVGLWKTNNHVCDYIKLKLYINLENENVIFEVGD